MQIHRIIHIYYTALSKLFLTLFKLYRTCPHTHTLQDSKSASGLYFKQLEESALRADELAAELDAAHSEIQVNKGFHTDILERNNAEGGKKILSKSEEKKIKSSVVCLLF